MISHLQALICAAVVVQNLIKTKQKNKADYLALEIVVCFKWPTFPDDRSKK